MKGYENFSGKAQHELEEYIARNAKRQQGYTIIRDIRNAAGYNPSKYMDLLVWAAHIVRGETDCAEDLPADVQKEEN